MMLKYFRSVMLKSFLLQSCIVLLFISFATSVQPPLMPKIDSLQKIPSKGKLVPPCIACQKLVQSFLSALAETTRQSFAGGDADWEKQKLGTYENSELRFIEIQEILCADIDYGKDQCYNLAEQCEPELEDWFYENRKKNVNLHESLCINHLKVCCPNNTYGPNCVPCPGGTENPCGGHGKCKRGGTREEPASCSCDAGYTGDLCDRCQEGYYQENQSSTLSCKLCNKACKGHCRGPGPKNCEVCAFGFHFTPDEGCADDSAKETDVENTDISRGTDNRKTSGGMNQSDQESASAVSKNQDQELNLKSNIKDSNLEEHFEL